MVARAHALGLKVIIDQVSQPFVFAQHPFFKESRSSRSNPKSDWYVWADANPDGTPPNNWVSVFGGSAWEWDTRRRQYYLHNFLASQPDFNFHNPAVQDWLLSTMRFWLDRGVDGFRLDTVNFYFHDALLRSNPPAPPGNDTAPAVNPYEMQLHLHSKTQPENIAFLQRMRTLLDAYRRPHDGRRGRRKPPRHAGDGRLHPRQRPAAHGLQLRDARPAVHRRIISAAGSRSSSTARRTAARPGPSPTTMSSAMSPAGPTSARRMTLPAWPPRCFCPSKAAICLYQGEELGQTETDIEYHELTDPPGFTFWPDYKGRDGCRTPMVWDGSANGGFTTGTPWLPVKAPQLARNVARQRGVAGSVLETYRALLAFRRASPALSGGHTRFLDLPEPVLAFLRDTGTEVLGCVFNLSADTVTLAVEGGALTGPSQAAGLVGPSLTLGPDGFAFLAPTGSPKALIIAP